MQAYCRMFKYLTVKNDNCFNPTYFIFKCDNKDLALKVIKRSNEQSPQTLKTGVCVMNKKNITFV